MYHLRLLNRSALVLLLFLSFNAYGQSCATRPPGIVSWWRGENDAQDVIGGNHATFSSASFGAGKVGQAFNFTGSQFVQAPDNASLDFSNAFTIELWVSPTVAGEANGTTFLVSKGNMNFVTTQSYGILFDSSRRVQIRIANGSALESLASVTALALGTYSHVAVTYNGSEMRVYVNGALESSQATSIGTLLNTSGGLILGGADFGGGTKIFSQAGLDEVSLYDHALSASEISSIFNASSVGKCVPVCVSPPTGLVSWWRAENSTLDFLGSNDGSLIGTVSFTNGFIGRSFFFNGSSYVQVPSSTSLSITNAMTLEGWVFQTSAALGGTIASKYATGNGRSSWYLEMIGNQINFHVDGDGNPFNGVELEVRTPVGSVSTGVWTHVAATVVASNQDLKIYINGVESPTTVAVGGTITRIASTAEPLRIASNFSAGQNTSLFRFRGMIDDFSVYDRALTSNEIAGLSSARSAGKCLSCVPPAPNIVGWWRAENNGEDSINNNAALLGGGTTFTNGFVGRAFSFDGVDDVALAADAAFGAATNSFTMEMWAFPTVGRGAVAETVSSQTGIGTGQRYAVFPAHGDNSFGSGHAGAGISIGTNGVTVIEHGAFYIPSPLVFDAPLFGWNHIAVVYSNNQASLYVNGKFARTGLASPRIVHPSAQLGGGVYGYFSGFLDEYAVYSRALSANEVRAIFIASSAGKCVSGPIAPLVLLPTNTNAIVGTSIMFTASGGAAPYLFSLVTNNSGGSVNPFSGIYVAGPIANGVDTVRLRDSFSNNVFATITVQPDLTPRPDMAIHQIIAPSNVQPGLPFQLIWVVTNRGNATATAPWTEQVFASTDAAVGSDSFLRTLTATASLAVGASVTRTQLVTIPSDGDAGPLHLVVALDTDSIIHESNDSNNTSVSGVINMPFVLTLTPTLASPVEGQTASFTVSRNGSRSAALVVNLLSGDTTELSLPGTVIIPSGAASVGFNGTTIVDGLFDGAQVSLLTASAPGFSNAVSVVTVLDADVPHLLLTLATNRVIEGGSVQATVSRELVSTSSLAVELNGGDGQIAFPGLVTIPANSNSATFLAIAVGDTLVERTNTYTFTASATGYQNASVSLTVEDDDIPAVVMAMANHTISEGAGASATTATATRDRNSPRALVLSVFSSNTNAARVPSFVTIPAGQTNATFPIAAVNDSDVNGSRLVTISGFVLETTTGLPLRPVQSDTVTVTDDDGPQLRLTLAQSFVGEGLSSATTATLSRNNGTNGSITVNLSSSDMTEATVPSTVVIPNGSGSVTFAITTLNDGTNDGNQTVTIGANAAGFAPASETLVVSDVDLPDLRVASVNALTNAVTGQQIDVLFRVENQGLASTSSNFLQRISLSSDKQVGNDTVLAQASFNGTLPVGQFFEQTLRVFLPQTPGIYWLVAVVDANNQVAEGLEDNNARVTAIPLVVSKSYSATVNANVETAAAGTAVLLSGHATRTGTNSPAAFELVNVHLKVRGTKRILTALTDADGNYAVIFNPLPGEAGIYTAGADHPGVTDTPVQDTFTLLGLRVPPQLTLRVFDGTSATNSTYVENLSDIALTGLAASIISGPSNVSVSVEFETNALPGDGFTPMNVIVTAPQGIAGSAMFTMAIVSAEGASNVFSVPVVVELLAPRLTATPGSLATGMRRGSQTSVQFAVTNNGGAATGPLSILLPSLPWMAVSSGGQLPPLAPGAGTIVTVLLTPPSDLALGDHTGSLVVNGSNVGATVSFNFRSLSDNTGTLKLSAVDELTFYAEGAPKLSNATVRLSNPSSGDTILATNFGGQTELILTNLAEAFYILRIDAPDHAPYQETFLLKPDQTNDVVAFLSRQTVRYTWTVTPITIEDRYEIAVETTFETSVPIPVVTVEPTIIDVSDFPGETKQVNVTIANHGLLAAQNSKLSFDAHPNLSITPLIGDIGVIPAQSSLTIPVTLRKIGLAGAAPAKWKSSIAKAGGGDCQLGGKLEWSIDCAGQQITTAIPLKAINLNQIGVQCGSSAQSFFVSGGIPAGFNVAALGGGIGNPGYNVPIAFAEKSVCDPCFQKVGGGLVSHCLPLLPIPLFDDPPHREECESGTGTAAQFIACMQDASDQLQEAVGEGLDTASDAGGSLGDAADGAKNGLDAVNEGLGIAACLAPLLDPCVGGPQFFGGGSAKSSFAKSSTPPITAPLSNRVYQVLAFLGGYTNLLGSDIWFRGTNVTTWTNWFSAYRARIHSSSDGGARISTNERIQLFALPFPTPVGTNDVVKLIDRWNRTVDYYEAGIFYRTNVPPGQSLDFIARDERREVMAAADAAYNAVRAEGFNDVAHAYNFTRQELLELLFGRSDGVCAKVRLRLEQQLVISRDAFKAMLEIENGTGTPLEEIGVTLLVTDAQGSDRTALFQIRPPTLDGITAVDGAGILPAQSDGNAGWVLVPASDAAPTNTTRYFVSGTLTYRQNGTTLTIPLAPTAIDVLPNPRLIVDYFHERDVFSDDPFTPEIEPAIPYSLAVRIRNNGFGTAQNMHIMSGQPVIVDNDKGLFINFEIIATEVAGVRLTPALTADFGDINPGQIAIGRWLFKSSLQGLFTDYDATFQHVSGLGDRRFSLVDSVNIHEMIHLVQADRTFEDSQPDFLVNDVPDLRDLPDTLHFSGGSNAPVNAITNGIFDAPVSAGHLTAQLTITSTSGWVYLRLPDPADQTFRLLEVRRADNSKVLLNTNVWRTDRTFIGFGQRPLRENTLHLLDFNSAGTYTLLYEPAGPVPDTNAPSSAVAVLPAASPASFNVTWFGTDGTNGSGLAYFDIFVSVDSGPFTNWLTHATANGALFNGEPNRMYAFFSRAIDAEGNTESAPGAADAQTSTTIINTAPMLSLGLNQSIDEGTTLMLTASVTDTDAPPQTLTYALLPGTPPGVSLNSLGTLTFPTSEGTGPSTNILSVRVTDNGVPPLSATSSVTVVVREVNSPPIINALAGRTINEGSNLVVTAVASDFDLPANTLVFTLGPNAPAGAGITPGGVFSWRPSSTQGPSSNRLDVIVTDSGAPPLSTTQTLVVVVRDTRADFMLGTGSTNVFVNKSNSVPLRLNAGLDLSEVTFTLSVSNQLIGNFALGSFAPDVVSASLVPLNTEQSQLHFVLGNGTPLDTDRTLAQLGFIAGSNGASAIVPLFLNAPIGLQPGGGTVTNAALFPGHIVVVDREPVLEAEGAGVEIIRVFARPGNYRIEYTTNLNQAVTWQTISNFSVFNSSARLVLPIPPSATRYYRVVAP